MSIEVVDRRNGAEQWERPLPAGEGEFGELFEHCADGRFVLQRCEACAAWQHYPGPICRQCGATPVWREASGAGTVHTFTVVHRTPIAPFRGLTPYAVAVVELDEGPRLLATVLDDQPDSVAVGARVAVVAELFEDGRAMPMVVLVDAGG